MKKTKVGLLPLYIELYDQCAADSRPRMQRFYNEIASALEGAGLAVARAPICRLKGEFDAAISAFERDEVDALVTLHLAYSPSLESATALAATRLPVIVLDTTPTYEFGPDQVTDEIIFNHGIHGVQDMCNLLVRNGKPFAIEAGHWRRSNVMRRVVQQARAARIAGALRQSRVGLIGQPFKGMGDFAVPVAELKRAVGISVVPATAEHLRQFVAATTDVELDAEVADDQRRFHIASADARAHRMSVRAGLGVRRWIAQERLTAFSFNFLVAGPSAGLPTVPFLEASRAMARGVGYAGEGDVLTAALVGALSVVCPATTFTEMFCPDWKDDRVFLSHMGEVNIDLLADARPRLRERTFMWPEGQRPLAAVGCLRAGQAVFVNVAPLGDGRYRLILSPCAMIAGGRSDHMTDSVHGWLRPRMQLDRFLEAYSRAAGTHHAALVYGNEMDMLRALGRFLKWETVVLE